VAWGFRDADIAGDDRLIHRVPKEAAGIGGNQVGQVVPAIVHGQHDALETECRIEAALHHLDGPDQSADPFKGVEFALERHKHGVRRDQAVQSEKPEARRAVDQDEAEVTGAIAQGRQGIAEAVFAPVQRDKLDFGARQIGFGGDQGQFGDLGGPDGL
jgi:hypothetical protein